MNSGFFYKSASERETLVAAERKFVDDRVQKIIDLKNKVRGVVSVLVGVAYHASSHRCVLTLGKDLSSSIRRYRS